MDSIGDSGAASGFCLFAIAMAALAKGYAPGPILLCQMSAESGRRAAVIVRGHWRQMGANVFSDGMEIACKAGAAKVICALPDVCLSPPTPPAGPVPIPYPVTSMDSDTADGSRTVKIGGQEVMLKSTSNYKKCVGDEAATKSLGMGVVTHCIGGKTYFAAWSSDVKVEGENADRNLDVTNSNGQSTTNQVAWPNTSTLKLPSGEKCSDVLDAAGVVDPPVQGRRQTLREGRGQTSNNPIISFRTPVSRARAARAPSRHFPSTN